MSHKKTSKNRRSEILKTAERLFTHYGYEKTTMEDISREAGIPRATIYLEFPGGKEAILMANMAEYMERMLSEMRQITRSARTGRLQALKQALLHYVLAAYDKASHQFDPNNVEKCSKRIRNEMGEFFKRRDAFLAEILQQAALAGEIPETADCKQLAKLLAQGCLSWMPLHTMHLPRDVVESQANAFFSVFLTGLAHSAKNIRKKQPV